MNYFPKQKINVINQFVNRFNLKQIVLDGDIDFLSMDIDGNDYWVLKELNLDKIKLVCCEYNPFFGNNVSVTIKYNENHYHKGDFYFGASLQAFTNLFKEKKFELIAVDSSGTNAFFINKNNLSDFEVLDSKKSFKNSGACTYSRFIEINKKLKKRDGLVYLNEST